MFVGMVGTPISDNAGGIAEMSQLDEWVRERTDVLDAAENTTAANGKGFAIGSAALVSLAQFGAFCVRADITGVDILHLWVFTGMLFGAMMPYALAAPCACRGVHRAGSSCTLRRASTRCGILDVSAFSLCRTCRG